MQSWIYTVLIQQLFVVKNITRLDCMLTLGKFDSIASVFLLLIQN